MKSSKILSRRFKIEKPTQHCLLLKIKTDLQNKLMLRDPVKCVTLHLVLLLSYFSELDSQQHNLWSWWWLAGARRSELLLRLTHRRSRRIHFQQRPYCGFSHEPFLICQNFTECRQVWRWLCPKIFRKKKVLLSRLLHSAQKGISAGDKFCRLFMLWLHLDRTEMSSAFHQVRDVFIACPHELNSIYATFSSDTLWNILQVTLFSR